MSGVSKPTTEQPPQTSRSSTPAVRAVTPTASYSTQPLPDLEASIEKLHQAEEKTTKEAEKNLYLQLIRLAKHLNRSVDHKPQAKEVYALVLSLSDRFDKEVQDAMIRIKTTEQSKKFDAKKTAEVAGKVGGAFNDYLKASTTARQSLSTLVNDKSRLLAGVNHIDTSLRNKALNCLSRDALPLLRIAASSPAILNKTLQHFSKKTITPATGLPSEQELLAAIPESVKAIVAAAHDLHVADSVAMATDLTAASPRVKQHQISERAHAQRHVLQQAWQAQALELNSIEALPVDSLPEKIAAIEKFELEIDKRRFELYVEMLTKIRPFNKNLHGRDPKYAQAFATFRGDEEGAEQWPDLLEELRQLNTKITKVEKNGEACKQRVAKLDALCEPLKKSFLSRGKVATNSDWQILRDRAEYALRDVQALARQKSLLPQRLPDSASVTPLTFLTDYLGQVTSIGNFLPPIAMPVLPAVSQEMKEQRRVEVMLPTTPAQHDTSITVAAELGLAAESHKMVIAKVLDHIAHLQQKYQLTPPPSPKSETSNAESAPVQPVETKTMEPVTPEDPKLRNLRKHAQQLIDYIVLATAHFPLNQPQLLAAAVRFSDNKGLASLLPELQQAIDNPKNPATAIDDISQLVLQVVDSIIVTLVVTSQLCPPRPDTTHDLQAVSAGLFAYFTNIKPFLQGPVAEELSEQINNVLETNLEGCLWVEADPLEELEPEEIKQHSPEAAEPEKVKQRSPEPTEIEEPVLPFDIDAAVASMRMERELRAVLKNCLSPIKEEPSEELASSPIVASSVADPSLAEDKVAIASVLTSSELESAKALLAYAQSVTKQFSADLLDFAVKISDITHLKTLIADFETVIEDPQNHAVKRQLVSELALKLIDAIVVTLIAESYASGATAANTQQMQGIIDGLFQQVAKIKPLVNSIEAEKQCDLFAELLQSKLEGFVKTVNQPQSKPIVNPQPKTSASATTEQKSQQQAPRPKPKKIKPAAKVVKNKGPLAMFLAKHQPKEQKPAAVRRVLRPAVKHVKPKPVLNAVKHESPYTPRQPIVPSKQPLSDSKLLRRRLTAAVADSKTVAKPVRRTAAISKPSFSAKKAVPTKVGQASVAAEQKRTVLKVKQPSVGSKLQMTQAAIEAKFDTPRNLSQTASWWNELRGLYVAAAQKFVYHIASLQEEITKQHRFLQTLFNGKNSVFLNAVNEFVAVIQQKGIPGYIVVSKMLHIMSHLVEAFAAQMQRGDLSLDELALFGMNLEIMLEQMEWWDEKNLLIFSTENCYLCDALYDRCDSLHASYINIARNRRKSDEKSLLTCANELLVCCMDVGTALTPKSENEKRSMPAVLRELSLIIENSQIDTKAIATAMSKAMAYALDLVEQVGDKVLSEENEQQLNLAYSQLALLLDRLEDLEESVNASSNEENIYTQLCTKCEDLYCTVYKKLITQRDRRVKESVVAWSASPQDVQPNRPPADSAQAKERLAELAAPYSPVIPISLLVQLDAAIDSLSDADAQDEVVEPGTPRGIIAEPNLSPLKPVILERQFDAVVDLDESTRRGNDSQNTGAQLTVDLATTPISTASESRPPSTVSSTDSKDSSPASQISQDSSSVNHEQEVVKQTETPQKTATVTFIVSKKSTESHKILLMFSDAVIAKRMHGKFLDRPVKNTNVFKESLTEEARSFSLHLLKCSSVEELNSVLEQCESSLRANGLRVARESVDVSMIVWTRSTVTPPPSSAPMDMEETEGSKKTEAQSVSQEATVLRLAAWQGLKEKDIVTLTSSPIDVIENKQTALPGYLLQAVQAIWDHRGGRRNPMTLLLKAVQAPDVEAVQLLLAAQADRVIDWQHLLEVADRQMPNTVSEMLRSVLREQLKDVQGLAVNSLTFPLNADSQGTLQQALATQIQRDEAAVQQAKEEIKVTGDNVLLVRATLMRHRCLQRGLAVGHRRTNSSSRASSIPQNIARSRTYSDTTFLSTASREEPIVDSSPGGLVASDLAEIRAFAQQPMQVIAASLDSVRMCYSASDWQHLLMATGVKNIRVDGQLSIHAYLQDETCNNITVIQGLLDKQIAVQDDNGNTPLLAALIYLNKQQSSSPATIVTSEKNPRLDFLLTVVNTILQHSDAHIVVATVNRNKQAPLELAVSAGLDEVVGILLSLADDKVVNQRVLQAAIQKGDNVIWLKLVGFLEGEGREKELVQESGRKILNIFGSNKTSLLRPAVNCALSATVAERPARLEILAGLAARWNEHEQGLQEDIVQQIIDARDGEVAKRVSALTSRKQIEKLQSLYLPREEPADDSLVMPSVLPLTPQHSMDRAALSDIELETPHIQERKGSIPTIEIDPLEKAQTSGHLKVPSSFSSPGLPSAGSTFFSPRSPGDTSQHIAMSGLNHAELEKKFAQSNTRKRLHYGSPDPRSRASSDAGQMSPLTLGDRKSSVPKTIFTMAAEGDSLGIKGFLANPPAGFDINARDSRGYTLLMYAAANGHAQALEKILQHIPGEAAKTVAINLQNPAENGRNALMLAVERYTSIGQRGQRYSSTINHLLAIRGIEVNQQYPDGSGDTVLTRAAKLGDLNLVEQLLLDANSTDQNKKKALLQAVENGNLTLIDMFRRFGVNVNSMMVMSAIAKDSLDLVIALLKPFATRGVLGGSAVNLNSATNIQLKTFLKAKILAIVAKGGLSSIEHFFNQDHPLRPYLYEILPEMPVALVANSQNEHGYTPLMRAIEEGSVETVRWLLSFPGVNVNLKNNQNLTALHLAVEKQNIAVIDLLINRGAIVRESKHTGGLSSSVSRRRFPSVDASSGSFESKVSDIKAIVETPDLLKFAIERGCYFAAHRLVERGARLHEIPASLIQPKEPYLTGEKEAYEALLAAHEEVCPKPAIHTSLDCDDEIPPPSRATRKSWLRRWGEPVFWCCAFFILGLSVAAFSAFSFGLPAIIVAILPVLPYLTVAFTALSSLILRFTLMDDISSNWDQVFLDLYSEVEYKNALHDVQTLGQHRPLLEGEGLAALDQRAIPEDFIVLPAAPADDQQLLLSPEQREKLWNIVNSALNALLPKGEGKRIDYYPRNLKGQDIRQLQTLQRRLQCLKELGENNKMMVAAILNTPDFRQAYKEFKGTAAITVERRDDSTILSRLRNTKLHPKTMMDGWRKYKNSIFSWPASETTADKWLWFPTVVMKFISAPIFISVSFIYLPLAALERVWMWANSPTYPSRRAPRSVADSTRRGSTDGVDSPLLSGSQRYPYGTFSTLDDTLHGATIPPKNDQDSTADDNGESEAARALFDINHALYQTPVRDRRGSSSDRTAAADSVSPHHHQDLTDRTDGEDEVDSEPVETKNWKYYLKKVVKGIFILSTLVVVGLILFAITAMAKAMFGFGAGEYGSKLMEWILNNWEGSTSDAAILHAAHVVAPAIIGSTMAIGGLTLVGISKTALRVNATSYDGFKSVRDKLLHDQEVRLQHFDTKGPIDFGWKNNALLWLSASTFGLSEVIHRRLRPYRVMKTTPEGRVPEDPADLSLRDWLRMARDYYNLFEREGRRNFLRSFIKLFAFVFIITMVGVLTTAGIALALTPVSWAIGGAIIAFYAAVSLFKWWRNYKAAPADQSMADNAPAPVGGAADVVEPSPSPQSAPAMNNLIEEHKSGPQGILDAKHEVAAASVLLEPQQPLPPLEAAVEEQFLIGPLQRSPSRASVSQFSEPVSPRSVVGHNKEQVASVDQQEGVGSAGAGVLHDAAGMEESANVELT